MVASCKLSLGPIPTIRLTLNSRPLTFNPDHQFSPVKLLYIYSRVCEKFYGIEGISLDFNYVAALVVSILNCHSGLDG